MTTQQIHETAKRAAKQAMYLSYSEEIITRIIAAEFLPFAEDEPSSNQQSIDAVLACKEENK